MMDDLLPLNLHGAARQLGVAPFEVIRLLVAAKKSSAGPLLFDEGLIAFLREMGQIEQPWWGGVDLPEDSNPLRQRVRAALGLLVERGHVGESVTRMDNVWRGLPFDDQELLQQAFSVLTEEGLLHCVSSPVGLMVSVERSASEQIDRIISGTAEAPGLAELYEG